MAPTSAAIGTVLKQAIYYHLDNASYDSALFFAERYTAQDPKSTDAVYLHGLSHLRLGDFRSAYDASKSMRNSNLGCAWVFAQACLALERYKDGIHALDRSKVLWSQRNSIGKHGPASRVALPDAPAMLCLMGKLYRGVDDKTRAIGCFEEAVKLNPFMWDAFKALCDMGVNVRVPNIFKANEATFQAIVQQTAQDSSDCTSSSSLASEPKKASLRTAATDFGMDPFTSNWTSSESNVQPFDIPSTAESDFMSKFQTARAKLVASSTTISGTEVLETPTGPPPLDNGARPQQPREPPQPIRRTRTAHSAEPSDEPPPRISFRVGAKKNIRSADKSSDPYADLLSETGHASTTVVRPSIPVGERKRTVSGHPVPRTANADDLTTRRSARLNMFKPSARANSGVPASGTTAGRELKKARPQISRIVRPGSSSSNVGRVVSGNRKPLEDHQMEIDQGEPSRPRENSTHANVQRSTDSENARTEEAVKWVLDLLKKLGQGYHLLSKFQCQESLQAWSSLPAAHQSTPWVLAQIGRAHFEQAAYAEAEKYFRKMRLLAPSRLEDMELYSTILWHLKREADLSFLAHELVDAAWHSPQAWCALGNAWSLARDPEQALRCFKRATQLDPKFAYAFTLQGHEHVANEEFEKAMTAYRQAIAADRRHYNAYYGIGRVQERLGAFDKAYTHFHAAQTINPNNAVLICCIGMALEKQKQIKPALAAYTKAVELSPRTAQTRFKKARALLAMGLHEAAQKELMVLKDLAPDEAPVHFLLGTLYRSMDERQLAVRHFTIALALDPKVSHAPLTHKTCMQLTPKQAGSTIKAAIERFEGDYAPDDSMMM